MWDISGKKNSVNEQNVSGSLQFLFDLGGRSSKTQINKQGKELKVYGCFYSCTSFSCFSHSDTVYPLNSSIYPSISKAQSYMPLEEKGPAFSFPPVHPYVLCSIIFCTHTDKKENCFPPDLTGKQRSLNSLVGKGWKGCQCVKGLLCLSGSALCKELSHGDRRRLGTWPQLGSLMDMVQPLRWPWENKVLLLPHHPKCICALPAWSHVLVWPCCCLQPFYCRQALQGRQGFS